MPIFARWLVVVIALCTATAGSTTGLCPSTEGRWGYGPSHAVVSFEERVFFGSGIFLQVAEISPEAEIEIVGGIELPGIIMDIEIRDAIAYIAASDAGLLLVDVSDPNSPAVIGRVDTPHTVLEVAVVGDIALVVDLDSGLRLVDIADPRVPRELSSLDLEGTAREVAAIGDTAYVWANHQIHIIDISRPLEPTIIDSFLPDMFANDITIHNGLAYIATYYEGLQIFDVDEPREPVFLGEYNPYYSTYSAVVVHGDHAFLGVTDGIDFSGDVGLKAVDVSDPTNPIGTSGSSIGHFGNSIRSLTVHGDLLVAAAEGDGLRVYETNSGLYLSEVGSHDVPGMGNQLAVSGTILYLGSEGEYGDGVRAFDVAHPSQPVLLGVTDDLQPAISIADLAEADDTLYLVVDDFHRDGPLMTVDITDPTSPSGAADTGFEATALDVSNGYLFAVEQRTLQVFDLSEPLAPVLIGSAPVPGECEDIDVEGDLAFVVSEIGYDHPSGGLHIFDVNDPVNPTLIGSLERFAFARTVAVQASFAYIADRGYLSIVDVSNPSLPIQVGELHIPSYGPKAIAVAGDTVLWSLAGWGGDHRQYVHIIDVHNPAAPRRRSRLLMDTYSIEAANGLFYIADKDGGFRIIDPSAPCHERVFSEIPPREID